MGDPTDKLSYLRI
ncbi:BgTH12-01999 [Blumeria graminis f. sp. triticale]|uniref:BgTH12-01999 n=1 Tax=Blumeria graminis f. sp. triticale TaxID=1689686 RepID=A0A9W4D5L7_BLUGR|nr:BgTH12-01999 [Blumeria graminis f. sp. triticale]